MTKFKLTAGIFIMLLISSTIVFSQTNTATKSQDNSKKTASVSVTSNFVDANNDGICDNCGKPKAECKDNKANCSAHKENCSAHKPNCSSSKASTADTKPNCTSTKPNCCAGKEKMKCCSGKSTGTKQN